MARVSKDGGGFMLADGFLRGCPPSPFETLAIARGRRAWSRSRLAPQGEGGPRPRPLRHVGWTLHRSFPRKRESSLLSRTLGPRWSSHPRKRGRGRTERFRRPALCRPC